MSRGLLLLVVIGVLIFAVSRVGRGDVEGVKTTGFDQFGYNITARLFNGTGSSWCQGKLRWTQSQCDSYMGAYANDKLIM